MLGNPGWGVAEIQWRLCADHRETQGACRLVEPDVEGDDRHRPTPRTLGRRQVQGVLGAGSRGEGFSQFPRHARAVARVRARLRARYPDAWPASSLTQSSTFRVLVDPLFAGLG